MSEEFYRTPHFTADVQKQFSWYWDRAGEEVAWRFERAVEQTLHQLALQPGLGRRRRFRNLALQGLRSFRVEPPFNKLILFYRTEGGVAQAVRLIHGSRDLPRRLLEAPGLD